MLVAAMRFVTIEWWETQSPHFELYTSDVTIEEAEKGHPEAAARRLEALDGTTVLPITDAGRSLAAALLHMRALPENAREDALHIAVSAVHNITYLLTWNFKHIANAVRRPLIREVCEQHGYRSPEIGTPSGLMGGNTMLAGEIMEELWEIKDSMAREHDADPQKFYANLKERQLRNPTAYGVPGRRFKTAEELKSYIEDERTSSQHL